MRLALFSPDVPGTPGGVADHTLALARALAGRGAAVTVLAGRGDAARFLPVPCRLGVGPGPHGGADLAGALADAGADTVLVQYVPFLYARSGVAPALVPALRRVREAGVRIEQRTLRIGFEQGLVRMLAMDVHQPFARLTQLAERRRPAVDESTRAPALVDYPPQQKGTGVALEFRGAQPCAQFGQRLNVEFGTDVRAFAIRAHHGRIAALAQGQCQRVDEDGFAGAGLAGEHSESGVEFEFERIDNDEIADAERPQHAYISLQCSFSRSMA